MFSYNLFSRWAPRMYSSIALNYSINSYSPFSFLNLIYIYYFFIFIFLYLVVSGVDYQNLFYFFEFSLLFPLFVLILGASSGFSGWDLKRLVFFSLFFPFIFSFFLLFFLPYGNLYLPFGLLSSNSYNFSSISQLCFFEFEFQDYSGLSTYLGSFLLYMDGVSYFFILLTTFLIPVCILVSWYSIQENVFLFLFFLIILEFFLINCFLVSNLFFFFLFFEAVLFPMFFIIGIWGSRDRKVHAVYQFLLYTLVGSVFLYLGLFYLLFNYDTLDYMQLLKLDILVFDQNLLFILFLISFAFKIPLFPVHIWLPEAHVEAPTFGSVILAGLLLKLGTYGMLRFLVPILPFAVCYFTPLVFTLVIVGVFYTSFSTTRQLDLKKIIAYSSVGHMGFVILGLFTTYLEGLIGSLFLMLGHGVVSSSLFICVGLIYDRYHTRNVVDLRCLVRFMPLFGVFFVLFTLANVSFPGTFNFVAEVNILVALAQINVLAAIVSLFSIVFIMVYSFWLNNRILFGSSHNVFERFFIVAKYADLSFREFVLLFAFAFFTIFFGFCPNIIIDFYLPYCDYINLRFDSNFMF